MGRELIWFNHNFPYYALLNYNPRLSRGKEAGIIANWLRGHIVNN